MSDVGPSFYTTNAEAVAPAAVAPAAPGAPASTVLDRLRTGEQPAPAATGSETLVAESGQYNPKGVSPNSVYMDGVGPVSRATNRDYWIGVAKGGNPIEMKSKIAEQRYRRLAEQAGGAQNAQDWNARVEQMYHEGLLDNQSASQLYNQFASRDHYVKSLTTAAEQLNAQINLTSQGLRLTPQGLQTNPTAMAGAEGMARGRVTGEGTGQTIDVPDETSPSGFRSIWVPHGSTQEFVQEQLRKARAGAGAGGAGGAARPGATVTPTQAFKALVSTEGSGPNSTSPRGARGTAQIIESTFDQFKKPGESYANEDDRTAAARRYVDHMHDKYAGDADRMAVGYFSGINNVAPLGSPTPWKEDRSDGNMTTSQYVQRYRARLGPTGGATPPATPPAVRAPGPQGAVTPAAPARNQYAGPGVPPADVVQGNADAIAGGMVARGADAATLAPGRGGVVAPGVTGATGTPVAQVSQFGIPGRPSYDLQQQSQININQRQAEAQIEVQKARDLAAVEEDKANFGALGDESKRIVDAGHNAQAKLQRIMDLKHAAQDFTTGPTAEFRTAALGRSVEAMRLLGIPPPDWMTKAMTGSEVIQKEGGALTAEVTRAMGSNEAASVFNSVRAFNPNMKMSEGGFAAVIASLEQGIQRDMDKFNFRSEWLADPAHKRSIDGMLTAFNKAHPVETYASKVIPFHMPTDQTKLQPGVWYATPPDSPARKNKINVVEWDGQNWKPVDQGH